jgi:hypothetical protein
MVVYKTYFNDYYRRESLPPYANTFTPSGRHPLVLEHYIGRSGADALQILKPYKAYDLVLNPETYARFERTHRITHKRYSDFNAPQAAAVSYTYLFPVILYKNKLKSNGSSDKLARFIAMVAGFFLFLGAYTMVRDIRSIINSNKVIKLSQGIKNSLDAIKQNNPDVEIDAIFRTLHNLSQVREKVYRKERIRSIINLSLTITLIAASMIAVVAAVAAANLLALVAVAVAGVMVLAVGAKAVVEWENRLVKKEGKEILGNTEFLFEAHTPRESTNILRHFARHHSAPIRERRT